MPMNCNISQVLISPLELTGVQGESNKPQLTAQVDLKLYLYVLESINTMQTF